MPPILSFRDLEVWQLGMALAVNVYHATEKFLQQNAMDSLLRYVEQESQYLRMSPKVTHGEAMAHI